MFGCEQPELIPRELATRFTDTNSYYVSESSVYRDPWNVGGTQTKRGKVVAASGAHVKIEYRRIASVNCQKARPLSKANATAFGVAHGTPFALHQTRSEY